MWRNSVNNLVKVGKLTEKNENGFKLFGKPQRTDLDVRSSPQEFLFWKICSLSNFLKNFVGFQGMDKEIIAFKQCKVFSVQRNSVNALAKDSKLVENCKNGCKFFGKPQGTNLHVWSLLQKSLF